MSEQVMFSDTMVTIIEEIHSFHKTTRLEPLQARLGSLPDGPAKDALQQRIDRITNETFAQFVRLLVRESLMDFEDRRIIVTHNMSAEITREALRAERRTQLEAL